MRKLVSTLFLLLVNGIALAQGTPNSSVLAPNPTDLSVIYLGQIFGTVGNVLHGTSGEMLGHLFYRFNQGVFIVAGMWLAYTTVTIVLRAAAEGSFMGAKQGSMGWFAMLRIPLGLALLMPIPSTGYEAYQAIVMEVVIQGVNLADNTWSWALQYLQTGGQLFVSPGSANASATQNAGGATVIAQAVFLSETCQALSNYYNSTNQQYLAPNQQYGSYQPQTDSTTNMLYFPGVGNVAGQEITPTAATCGYVSWDLNQYCSQGTTTEDSVACQTTQTAVQQVASDLQPAAKEFACSLVGSTTGYCEPEAALLPSANVDGETAITGSMVDYQNLMMTVQRYASGQASQQYRQFIISGTPAADGWIMAGRYYWDITRLNDQLNSQGGSGVLPILKPVAPQDSMDNYPGISQARTQIGASPTLVTNQCPSNLPAPLMTTACTNYILYFGATPGSSGGSGTPGGGAGGSGFAKWFASILSIGITPIMKLAESYSQHSVNPIMWIHNVGMACLGGVGFFWFSVVLMLAPILLAANICNSEQPLGATLNALVDWMKSFCMMVAIMLMSAGVMMAYYVPLYPYLLFTFGAIGWFITVIEAMVAAPLVCLGLTHPEGHDFLGRSEQALMLLLGVFLRPVLLLIGLISGMILSYVALEMLNLTFASVLTSLYAGNVSGSTGVSLQAGINATANAAGAGGLAALIVVGPALMVMFAMIVYMVINQCFSLIYVLPDNIMRWIGGPQQQDTTAQMAQQVGGAMKGFGEGAARALNTSGGSAKGPDKKKSGEGEGEAKSTGGTSAKEQGKDGASIDAAKKKGEKSPK